MLENIPGTATFRGSPEEIGDFTGQLRGIEESAVDGLLRAHGIDDFRETALVTGMGDALRSPLFALDVTVTGPGGHHHHEITAGRNAVGVRRSPVTAGVEELDGFPVVNLPGGLTRIVRFLPGADPAASADPILVSEESVIPLSSPEPGERTRAGEGLRDALVRAGHRVDQGSSWQLTQTRACWKDVELEDAEASAVHLRVGAQYFLLAESEAGIHLDPVPSIRAWETMIAVLPGGHEVGRPR